jgi:protein-S-isoprenylcysteine O-methyltransferase Ste14
MKKLELALPPVVVFLIFGGAMYVLDLWLPFGEFDFFGRQTLKRVLAGLALLIGCMAVLAFLLKRTSSNPMQPDKASTLVVSGIYNYSRNPMYLALLLVLLAWGIHLGNAFNTLLAAAFVGYMNRFQIVPEERALLAKFGSEYRRYCSLVRRWF